jgi:hypothetical protein
MINGKLKVSDINDGELSRWNIILCAEVYHLGAPLRVKRVSLLLVLDTKKSKDIRHSKRLHRQRERMNTGSNEWSSALIRIELKSRSLHSRHFLMISLVVD